MRKKYFAGCGAPLLIMAVMCIIMNIGALIMESWYFSESITAHHISSPYMYADQLYFGAGKCLYQLNIDGTELRKIVCKNGLFGSPVVAGQYAYAQLGSSLVAVDLTTAKMVWRAHAPLGYWSDTPVDTTFLVNDTVITLRRSGISVYDAQSGKTIWHYKNWWVHPVWVYNDQLWYIADPAEDWNTWELLLEILFEDLLSVEIFDSKDAEARSSPVISRVDIATGQVQQAIDLADLEVGADCAVTIMAIDAKQLRLGITAEATGKYRTLSIQHSPPIPQPAAEVPAYQLLPTDRYLYTSGFVYTEVIVAALESGGHLWLVDKDLAFIDYAESIEAINRHTGDSVWRVWVDSTYQREP